MLISPVLSVLFDLNWYGLTTGYGTHLYTIIGHDAISTCHRPKTTLPGSHVPIIGTLDHDHVPLSVPLAHGPC